MADAHYPVAIGHARERLGWDPKHRLRYTLPEMIRRLQQDPPKWWELNGLPWPENKENEKENPEASSKVSNRIFKGADPHAAHWLTMTIDR